MHIYIYIYIIKFYQICDYCCYLAHFGKANVITFLGMILHIFELLLGKTLPMQRNAYMPLILIYEGTFCSLIFQQLRDYFFFVQLSQLMTHCRSQDLIIYIANSNYIISLTGCCPIPVTSELDVEVKALIVVLHSTKHQGL